MAVAALRDSDLRQVRSALGLSQEGLARSLDVSTRSVERWEAGATPRSAGPVLQRLGQLGEIVELGREAYGDDFGRFLTTPRHSLGYRTPVAAIARGDLAEVIGILAQVAEGQLA